MNKPISRSLPHKKGLRRRIYEHRQLYLFLLLPLAYLIIFSYIPMAGVQIAFRKYNIRGGIWHSPWVGWDNFEKMFEAPMFWRAFRNTLIISFQNLLICKILLVLFFVCLY